MRKIAIIPSKTPVIPRPLVNYFEKAGWELYVMDGYSSIFEAYEQGIEKAKVSAKDYVIICHDDIHILTNPEDFNSIIEGFLQKNKIGFLGVAGTKLFQESAGMECNIPDSNIYQDLYITEPLLWTCNLPTMDQQEG